MAISIFLLLFYLISMGGQTGQTRFPSLDKLTDFTGLPFKPLVVRTALAFTCVEIQCSTVVANLALTVCKFHKKHNISKV